MWAWPGAYLHVRIGRQKVLEDINNAHFLCNKLELQPPTTSKKILISIIPVLKLKLFGIMVENWDGVFADIYRERR